MGDSVALHYKDQYDTAESFYYSGNKHDALEVLLALLDKPRINLYRLAATHFLIAKISFPDVLDPLNPIDVEKHAINSLRTYLKLTRVTVSMVDRMDLEGLIEEARTLLIECRIVKLDKAEWDLMQAGSWKEGHEEQLVEAKEEVDSDSNPNTDGIGLVAGRKRKRVGNSVGNGRKSGKNGKKKSGGKNNPGWKNRAGEDGGQEARD